MRAAPAAVLRASAIVRMAARSRCASRWSASAVERALDAAPHRRAASAAPKPREKGAAEAVAREEPVHIGAAHPPVG